MKKKTAKVLKILTNDQKAYAFLKEFLDRDNEPCRIDHNGFCQAHFCHPPCLVGEARKFLGEGT